MPSIAMNNAMLFITGKQQQSQRDDLELQKLLQAAAAAASDQTVIDVEEKTTDTDIKLLVRANHFDSLFATALIVDSYPDVKFSIEFMSALPDSLQAGSRRTMLIGFTDFTALHKRQLQSDAFNKFTVVTYNNVLDSKENKPAKSWFGKKADKPQNRIDVIQPYQSFDRGSPVGYGTLANLVSTTLTDMVFCWLARSHHTINNTVLAQTRIGVCRLVSGAYPIVMNGNIDVGESMGKEHAAIERETKAILYNLHVQLHHALRSKNYREALRNIKIDTNDQMYMHAWGVCNETYASSVVQHFFKIPNKSPIRIGTPHKSKPNPTFGTLTIGAKCFFCTESMWPLMKEIASMHSNNFVGYHDVGNRREYRVVCNDKAAAWAIAYSLGRIAWDDGTCIRAVGAKPQ